MRVLLDNVDLGSTSGPNSFGRQLTNELRRRGDEVINLIDAVRKRTPIKDKPDVHLAFIESNVRSPQVPMVQRLDGIYYNSDSRYGDWWLQNKRIEETYSHAAGVIFQSPFSRRLVEAFFGEKSDDNVAVIGNGVDLRQIEEVPVNDSPELDKFDTVWMSAANWRPHKRLGENVRYFLEHAGDNDVMVVAGADSGPGHEHERVVYLGELQWSALIGMYKRADNFIHLAYHDNCPNVIVDARASGCHIICASCAGSTSIAGPDATVIDEDDWDPGPIELYKPPQLDFTRKRVNGIESSIDIRDVAQRYVDFMSKFVQ